MSTPLHLTQTADGEVFKSVDFDSDPGDVGNGTKVSSPRISPPHDASDRQNNGQPKPPEPTDMDQSAHADEEDESLVGEYDTSVIGFGIGEAPPDSRPPKGLDLIEPIPFPGLGLGASPVLGRSGSKAYQSRYMKRRESSIVSTVLAV